MGDVAAAGKVWQGPYFGQPPWPFATRAARAGCHVPEGSAGAGSSCLPQPGFTSLSAFGGSLHLPSHASPSSLQAGGPRNARSSSVPPSLKLVPQCAPCTAARQPQGNLRIRSRGSRAAEGGRARGEAACSLSLMLSCSQSTVLI